MSFVRQYNSLSFMKHFNILVGLLVVFVSCQNIKKEQQDENSAKELVDYATFGAEVDTSAVKSDREIAALYNQLGESDSVSTKFKATVTEVCQAKGCWMKLQIGEGEEAMVRFKDYGFLFPRILREKRLSLPAMRLLT